MGTHKALYLDKSWEVCPPQHDHPSFSFSVSSETTRLELFNVPGRNPTLTTTSPNHRTLKMTSPQNTSPGHESLYTLASPTKNRPQETFHLHPDNLTSSSIGVGGVSESCYNFFSNLHLGLAPHFSVSVLLHFGVSINTSNGTSCYTSLKE